ncbi:MAG: hypothetical protein PHO07_04055, partial [Pirellulales bacterium]|nr:hypothetical protein [Pirellulales bacterium]
IVRQLRGSSPVPPWLLSDGASPQISMVAWPDDADFIRVLETAEEIQQQRDASFHRMERL